MAYNTSKNKFSFSFLQLIEILNRMGYLKKISKWLPKWNIIQTLKSIRQHLVIWQNIPMFNEKQVTKQ
jgi:hypothetical protein